MQIAGLALLAFGLIFAGIGYWFYRKVQIMKTWPSVQGTVLQSGVERDVSTDQDGTESTSYKLAVDYRYTVGSKTYTGSRIALATRGYGTRSAAEKRLSTYAPGAVVRVKYNPADPGSAVLEEAGAVVGWVFMSVGGAILAIGVLMLVMSLE